MRGTITKRIRRLVAATSLETTSTPAIHKVFRWMVHKITGQRSRQQVLVESLRYTGFRGDYLRAKKLYHYTNGFIPLAGTDKMHNMTKDKSRKCTVTI